MKVFVFSLLVALVLPVLALENDDICISKQTKSGLCFMGMGLKCKTSTHLKINNDIQEISVVKALRDGIDFFDFGSYIDIDGSSKTTTVGDDQAEQQSNMTFIEGSAFNSTMFPKGIVYRLGGATGSQNNGSLNAGDTTYITDEALFSMGMFSDYTFIATYKKDGVLYEKELQECSNSLNIQSSCGAFASALNTLQTLKVDNNNIIYNGDSVSAKNINPTDLNSTTDNLSCTDATNNICKINPPPKPSLKIVFQETSITGGDSVSSYKTETDEEYGDLNIRSNVSFKAPESNNHIMRIGDVEVTRNNVTLTFSSGYYFIRSFTTTKNNFKIKVDATDGPAWLIFNNGATFDSNNLEINYNGNVGNLLIYSNDFVSLGQNGSTNYNINAYIYTKGNFEILGNSNSGAGLKGAVTAEGDITLTKHKDIYYDASGLTNFGLDSCIGSSQRVTGIFDAWDTNKSILQRDMLTKVVFDDFYLDINQLDTTQTTKEQINSNLQQGVEFWLYDNATNSIIDNTTHIFTQTTSPTQTTKFVIPQAYKDVNVQFKICAYFNGQRYTLQEYNKCEQNTYYNHTCKANDITNTPCFRVINSSDNFAIRPNIFDITSNNTKMKLNSQNYLTFLALSNNNPTNNYYDTSNITAEISDSTKNCKHQTIPIAFSFNNGKYNQSVSDFYVGDFNITIQEQSGSEFALVDADDTPDNQRLITPKSKVFSFIPDSFELNTTLKNANDKFTYISDDLTHSATLNINIKAKKEDGTLTKNYTSSCYAKPINITIDYKNLTLASLNNIKSYIDILDKNNSIAINDTFLLSDLNPILFNEANTSFDIAINFDRNKTKTQNPFKLLLNFVTATDTDGTTSTQTKEQNATFVYGRTFCSRQTFEGANGSSNIYFEVYCKGDSCNKTILKNTTSPNLKNINDTRWFINEEHNITTDGNIGVVTQKYGDGISVVVNHANPSILNFTYDEKYDYPYKTTMQNKASKWLIYNKNSEDEDKNYFEIEFIKIGQWTGKYENKTTTRKINTPKINKRTIW